VASRLAAEKTAKFTVVGANKSGRPSKLTPERADQLVALLGAGVGVADTARELGISRRTIQVWRARAYSTRLEDQPYVDLERRIWRAIADGRSPTSAAKLTSWEEAAAMLEQEFPERWGEGAMEGALADLEANW
jgi:hypothetical protein